MEPLRGWGRRSAGSFRLALTWLLLGALLAASLVMEIEIVRGAWFLKESVGWVLWLGGIGMLILAAGVAYRRFIGWAESGFDDG